MSSLSVRWSTIFLDVRPDDGSPPADGFPVNLLMPTGRVYCLTRRSPFAG